MAEKFINIAFPFKDDNLKNYYLKMNKTGDDAIKSDLIHLLLTTPGGRLYLPEFGTNLRKFVFEPNDTTLREDIKAEIDQIDAEAEHHSDKVFHNSDPHMPLRLTARSPDPRPRR